MKNFGSVCARYW